MCRKFRKKEDVAKAGSSTSTLGDGSYDDRRGDDEKGQDQVGDVRLSTSTVMMCVCVCVCVCVRLLEVYMDLFENPIVH